MINIAVTGASGFVGKHLMERCTNEITFHPLSLNQLNEKEKSKLFDVSIDHVFHLAAKTYVPDSWINPHEFYQVNVMGTQRVLDFCKEQNCSLTYVSSYVYGVPQYLPIDELHALVPNTPYNHSKFMGEELCRFYHNAFNVNTAIIRPFNLYGPNQNTVFLIPTIIEQALLENKISLESLTPKRDYLFIDDFIDLLMATIKYKGCEVFNAGYGFSYSVKEIADIVINLLNKEGMEIHSANKIRNNEVMDVVANIDKAKKIFNWSPTTNLNDGLLKVIRANQKLTPSN
jgi:nucleoside-diphosphate-sugar epimerase